MSLFSFADIRFEESPQPRPSEQRFFGTGNSYNIHRFPANLGDTQYGHYMVFYINEQIKTKFSDPSPTNDLPTVIENRKNGASTTAGNIVSGATETILDLAQNFDLTRGIESSLEGILKETFGYSDGFRQDLNNFATDFTRTIRRTRNAIALYMPDTLMYTNEQNYSNMALGQSGYLAALNAGASFVSGMQAGVSGNLEFKDFFSQNLSPFLQAALYPLIRGNDLFRSGFAAMTGLVQNPLLEMLYTSPAFRQFRFDFMLYPRDESEAAEVHEIIRLLKFHQAPEIRTTGDATSLGYFLVPPSEFDIKFYYNGKENLNIPKISTCVLSSIDVDYAPNGFSAYEVPGDVYPSVGGTGTPVAIRLSLQFTETEYLTKEHFKKEGPCSGY